MIQKVTLIRIGVARICFLPSISSQSSNGKSFNFNDAEYYTNNQLETFKKKKLFCFARFELNTSNIIALFAVGISIFAYFKEPADKTQTIDLNRNHLIILTDSIVSTYFTKECDTVPKQNYDSIPKITRHNNVCKSLGE